MATGPGRPDLAVEPESSTPGLASPGLASPGMASPTASLISTPFIHPEPAYIAAKEAAFIITREVFLEYHMMDEDDITQMQDSSLSQISATAVASVNAFLDRILLNILSNARSLSLVSLRPAVRDVLRPKLAQEAIAGADEELVECIGEDDDADLFEDAPETQDAPWDLDSAWKRARLRCMVYTRLGDMEEEDEERYIDEYGLEVYSDGRVSRNSSMVSPPVAIWLTAILEYIGENVIMVASHAAYKRCENKYGRGIAGQALHPSVVLVGDNDLEKIALSPVLGRLWRAWRKPIRSPKAGISRTMSIDSIRHRRIDSRSSTGLAKKTSNETLGSSRPEVSSRAPSAVKEQEAPEVTTAPKKEEKEVVAEEEEEGEAKKEKREDKKEEQEGKEEEVVVDPTAIPIPISEHDVLEIEIPWFRATARFALRPASIIFPHQVFELKLNRDFTASPEVEEADQDSARRRFRSNSFPITRGDTDSMMPNSRIAWSRFNAGGNTPSKANSQSQNAPPKSAEAHKAAPKDPKQTQKRDLTAPAEMTKAEKRLSTLSQRRRSKRLSHYSNADRKSQVSDISEPNGPALFSRSDYSVEPSDKKELHPISTEAPPFSSNVTAPTPIADQPLAAPEVTKSQKRKSLLSINEREGSMQALSEDAGYDSSEISPLDSSDDEEASASGSGSIAGLKDAQEHMSVPTSYRARPVSMAVSPIVEQDGFEDMDAPVSPVSPEDERERPWPADQLTKPPTVIEQQKRPALPPTAEAPPAAQVPAIAAPPIADPIDPTAAAIAISSVSPLAGPSVAPAPVSHHPRASQPMGRQESDEKRREAVILGSPPLDSPATVQKAMPNIPKEAQAGMLAAAAAAHATVAVPQPESLYKSFSQGSPPRNRDAPVYSPRTINERSSKTASPVQEAVQQATAMSRESSDSSRALRVPSQTAIPPDSVITAVTTAPVPVAVTKRAPAPTAQVSNAPIIKPGTQASNAPSFKTTAQASNAPVIRRAPIQASDYSTATVRSEAAVPQTSPTPINTQLPAQPQVTRKGLPQDSRSSPGPSSITPLKLGQASPDQAPAASRLLERRRQLPQVDTASPERAAVHRLSPSPTSPNELPLQAATRSFPETVQGTSPVPRRKAPSRNTSRSGDDLLYSEQQKPNPEKAKEFNELIESDETIQFTLTPQNLRGVQADKWKQDGQGQAMDRDRSFSGSNGQIAGQARSASKTFAGFPVKIPIGAVRSSARQSMTKSGLAPRGAKTDNESMREFADFMRTTGPTEQPGTAQTSNVRVSASLTNIRSGKRAPQPVASSDIAARPAVASMPTASSSARRSIRKLEARDPQASQSGVSDLIDFMREESPRAQVTNNGAGRVTSSTSYGGSVNSTQESFNTGSINSHTGLLAGRGGYSGGQSEEMIMPVRKSRKPRDPYAIDDDDDILEEEEDYGGGNEESLADFLRSSGRISSGSTSNTGSASIPSNVNGAHPPRLSSIGRPIGPGGIPNRASLQARGASGSGSSTMDLADFLRNSGPPPGTISRIPEEAGPAPASGERKGLGKVFGSRRQRA